MKSLKNMTLQELGGYAKTHGIETPDEATKEERIKLIEAAERNIKRISVMGVNVSVDMGVFDDLELLDMMDDFQNGNVLKFKKILDCVFGDQSSAVYEALRNENNVVTASKASDFFSAVMEETNAKN